MKPLNAATLTASNTGFKTLFNNAFAGVKPEHEKVAMMVKSSGSQNVYAWLGNMARIRRWLGDRHINNLKTHNYTVTNQKFEETIAISKDAFEDDELGVYSPMFQNMGHDVAMFPDELVFNALKNGFTEKCYDGQNFFDEDHPVLDENGEEQSVSNMQSGTSPAWFLLDTSRPVKPLIYQLRRPFKFVAKDKPTDDNVFDKDEYVYGVDGRCNVGYGLWPQAFGSKAPLNAENYAAARAAMASMKGDGGKPLGVKGTLLVVPPTLESKGREILLAERDANGATNTQKGTAELLVASLLA